MNALVSKARKPKFELQLKIIDLNNVPLVTGTSYIKWHIQHSTSAEHRGRTSKEPIQDHKVIWNYTHIVPVRLVIDSKDNTLHECMINFEIVQEYGHMSKMEKMNLGHISLNLSEYVDAGEEEDEEGIVRRYLMQDSKINSTLKIGISMRQTDGEKNFVAPPLRTAPVFGGITGIVAGEQGDSDDVGHIPSVANKSREVGELQDMYRRTLAASWVAQDDELPADQCIEDLFSGGDGWKNGYRTTTHDVTMPSGRDHRRQYMSRLERDDSGSPSGEDKSSPSRRHVRNHSAASGQSNLTVLSKASTRTGVNHARKHSRTGSAHLQDRRPVEEERGRSGKPIEVGEFDLRDDLIAWRLPGRIQVSE